MRLLICCLFLFFGSKSLFAQDQIAQKIEWYGKAKPTTNLFVHFDKNIYTNNETVWFTGYLLKQNPYTQGKHQVMVVSLVRDVDSTIVIQDKFFIEDGLAFGNLNLPDSLITGDYHLMAHTDIIVNDKPDALFLQAITIKTNIEPAFKASMKILKEADLKQNINQILLAVTSKESTFLPKPTSISYRYGNINKITKTDASGQLLINLPVQNNLTDPNLYVKLKYQNDSSFINIPLTSVKQSASVNFYPEGGNLINGLTTTIGLEVKDQYKTPLATYAFLYKNDEIVDTIETNSYGIGKFKLNPIIGANYKVKLQHDNLVDSIYSLPSILSKGLVITMENAIVTDTLKLSLRTNDTRKLNLRIHNFRENYMNVPFDMELNRRTLKIPLTEIPKGLAALTITDSLGRPLAERIFFAHYNDAENIGINTDQPIYKQREKVSIKLNLPAYQDRAMVSIACVQDNRIEMKKMTDIQSFAYLNSELATLPTHLENRPFLDKAYLEQVLFIKGWRKYSWQELHQTTALDTIFTIDSLRVSGQVTKSNRDLTKAIQISTLGTANLNLIQTTATGSFNLLNEEILSKYTKPIFLFVNNTMRSDYAFKIKDGYLDFANRVIKKTSLERFLIPSKNLNNTTLVLKNNEKSIRLQEVEIVAKKDNSLNFVSGTNACGDYVCVYNILNCRNHSNHYGNKHPIAGKSYMVNGVSQIYLECKLDTDLDKFAKLNGIHIHKEFYVDEYKEQQEPAFFSTIYWSHATILNADKETELSFYTSDITGRFRIVVQGITNKDVVYAEKFFEVKPKLTP